MNGILNEKTIEIEHLKKQQIESARKHKNESVSQTEKLMAKENIINVNKTQQQLENRVQYI